MGRYHSPPVAECTAGEDSEMTMTSAVPAQVACGPPRPCAPRAVAGLGVQCGVGGLAVGQTGHCLRAWQAAATRYGTSSQSEFPAGRDGTLAHPEQLAGPCLGPPELRSCSSGQGRVSCPAFSQVLWRGGRREDVFATASSARSQRGRWRR